MFPPSTSYPFISQNPDVMYSIPQEFQGQQYPQEFMTTPQYYPLQDSFGMFGDNNLGNTNGMFGENNFGNTYGMFGDNNPANTYGMFGDNNLGNNMGMFGDNNPGNNMGMFDNKNLGNINPEAKLKRDPPPLLSNNPATATIVLFKELTAFPNYGNPSRNADILYTGNRGTWTFESPAFLFVPGNLRAQIRIRAVLDDHSNVPVNRYSARITINGNVVHNGRLNLVHGMPAGGIFTNWRDLTFNVTNLRRVTRVTIENTSTAGPNDWIAFDWMELRLVPR